MKAVNYIRKGWTQHANARTRNGESCPSRSSEAVKWCAEGALLRVYGAGTRFFAAREKLRRVVGFITLINWNDAHSRTQQQVIEAMEKAGV